MDLHQLAGEVIAGRAITPEEALEILRLPDSQTLPLVAAAGQLRRHYFGTTMKVNYLINLKSGLCPEDCSYCSQRLGSQAEILKYRWLRNEDAVAAAEAGIAGGAQRVCLVASGRGPSHRGGEPFRHPLGVAQDALGVRRLVRGDVDEALHLGGGRGPAPGLGDGGGHRRLRVDFAPP